MVESVNRQYKDRLFKVIFGENKEYALSLYNALNGSNYQDPDKLKVYTIENAVYMGMHNDFSFILDGDLIMFEQQSSYNPNMPLRGLFYLSRQYEKYIKVNNLLLYSSCRKMIPTPKYIVFYNGDTMLPEREVLKLSDSYINRNYKNEDYVPSLEVKCLVININAGNNENLLNACTPLMDYANFVECVKINKKNGLSDIEAVEQAVDDAIEKNFLNGWFKSHRAEAIGMILTEYDEKKVMQQLAEESKEEGRAEGRAEGFAAGMDQLSSLGQILIAQNKTSELQKAFTDSNYRDELMKQYNI